MTLRHLTPPILVWVFFFFYFGPPSKRGHGASDHMGWGCPNVSRGIDSDSITLCLEECGGAGAFERE